MKGLKENIQDKKEKLDHANNHPNSPKPEAFQRNSPKQAQSRLGETTPKRLDFFLVQLAQACPITLRQEVT